MWMANYGFETPYRRDNELELLAHYHSELTRLGVSTDASGAACQKDGAASSGFGHSIERCAFHYADEAGFMFAQQIIAVKDLQKSIEKDPKSALLFKTVLTRLSAFIQDWGVCGQLKFNLARVKEGREQEPISPEQFRACIPEEQMKRLEAAVAAQASNV